VNVADWLRTLGLEKYEALFRENDIDAEVLPKLGADDLRELGIRPHPRTRARPNFALGQVAFNRHVEAS
jgi:hypothetical protein